MDKKYTWRGLLINVTWRVVIPSLIIWLVAYLIDHKIIQEGTSYDELIVGLMVALIIGTGIGALTSIYYFIMIFLETNDQR